MKPEKTLEAAITQRDYYREELGELISFLGKKVGRLVLVEEMMRKHATDMTISGGASEGIYAVYTSEHFVTMLEELQAVIAEIDKKMSS